MAVKYDTSPHNRVRHATGYLPAAKRRVATAAEGFFRVNLPLFISLNNDNIPQRTASQRAPVFEARDSRWLRCHFAYQFQPGQMPRLYEGFHVKGQGCFQPQNTKWGAIKFKLFFFAGVWGMICRQAVNGSIN